MYRLNVPNLLPLIYTIIFEGLLRQLWKILYQGLLKYWKIS